MKRIGSLGFHRSMRHQYIRANGANRAKSRLYTCTSYIHFCICRLVFSAATTCALSLSWMSRTLALSTTVTEAEFHALQTNWHLEENDSPSMSKNKLTRGIPVNELARKAAGFFLGKILIRKSRRSCCRILRLCYKSAVLTSFMRFVAYRLSRADFNFNVQPH